MMRSLQSIKIYFSFVSFHFHFLLLFVFRLFCFSMIFILITVQSINMNFYDVTFIVVFVMIDRLQGTNRDDILRIIITCCDVMSGDIG